jgi:hypothetical protein
MRKDNGVLVEAMKELVSVKLPLLLVFHYKQAS